MKPRGMPSRWVKVLPWYYTRRRQPARAAEFRLALIAEEPAPSPFFDERDLAVIGMQEDDA